jgi:hypothetical protein
VSATAKSYSSQERSRSNVRSLKPVR